MAQSTISSDNRVTKFLSQVYRTYVAGGRFGPYQGTSENAVVQVKRDLKKVSVPLVGELSGNGVSGSGTLTGNEESLSNYAFELTPTYYRNGVVIDNEEREKSEFDLYREARPTLQDWMMKLKRDQTIEAMCAVEAGGTYLNYGDASDANHNTWLTNNNDRVLYGAAKNNTSAGDHSASLANLTTADDRLDAAQITLLKRIARSASPLIRPVTVDGDVESFVYFVDPYGFRDLKEDSTIAQANREARKRGLNNPIFADGDLMYDGVVIKEIPEIAKFIDDTSSDAFSGVWGANATANGLNDAGGSSSRVGVGFLCGAQAIGMGIGRMPEFKIKKEDDYGHQNGVGISCKHDIKKFFYNNKQHGVVTHFFSAPLDS